MKREQLTEQERDNLARVKANKARIARECAAAGRKTETRLHGSFADLEREYAKAHPHLMEQRHCGMCEDSARPARRVVMPNGVVIHSTWYKVPTTDADHAKAFAENKWLWEEHKRRERLAQQESEQLEALKVRLAEADWMREANDLLEREAA